VNIMLNRSASPWPGITFALVGALNVCLILVLSCKAVAQTESQIQSDGVRRVGSHLSCQCGGCNDNVNCMMSGGQCPFCKPARTKIFQMQQAGTDDSAIIASFLRDFGARVFRPDPSSYFWLVPYVSLGVGGIVIVLILKRASVRAREQAMIPASAGEPSAGSPRGCRRIFHALPRDRRRPSRNGSGGESV
jgi:cytochrome c-type biogenesis protein CcmH/NrfF